MFICTLHSQTWCMFHILTVQFAHSVFITTTTAPQEGFELATNSIQFYVIANLDQTSGLLLCWLPEEKCRTIYSAESSSSPVNLHVIIWAWDLIVLSGYCPWVWWINSYKNCINSYKNKHSEQLIPLIVSQRPVGAAVGDQWPCSDHVALQETSRCCTTADVGCCSAATADYGCCSLGCCSAASNVCSFCSADCSADWSPPSSNSTAALA